MDVVERRIAEGDYMLKGLPGERKLAEEVGVSYMTARKAVLKLIEKQVLTRKPNGSLVVHPRMMAGGAVAQVALLTPAYPSPHLLRCRLEITRAAERQGVQLRPVEYVHWYDPVVKEALQGSDGALIIPSTEPLPAPLLKELRTGEHKVVFFDSDFSDQGVPSIRLFARSHITKLLDHLWSLGHRRIDCLNAQGHNDEIGRRIQHWRQWVDHRQGEGVLWDEPAAPFADPISSAHEMMRRVLRDEARKLSAVVCTTQPAALGAVRACHDAGVEVGSDVSICTINNEPTGRFFVPSLTGLEMPRIGPLVERCFAWFAEDDAVWEGDLRVAPEKPDLLRGESTGRARRGWLGHAEPADTSASGAV
ncbi:MAG: LacI family DNA-binding transcriptional regulator [Planctomycetota bacterium]